MENKHTDPDSMLESWIKTLSEQTNACDDEAFPITIRNKRTFQTGELLVLPQSTLRQIAEAAVDLIGVTYHSPGLQFEVESGKEFSDPDLTVEELGLYAGSELWIYDDCGVQLPTHLHCGTINNTAKRLNMELPTKREQCRQHLVASKVMTCTGYLYQFSIKESTLADLVHPYDWLPKGYGDGNLFVEKTRCVLS